MTPTAPPVERLVAVPRHAGEIEIDPAVLAQQVEAAPQAGQHAERQDIHL